MRPAPSGDGDRSGAGHTAPDGRSFRSGAGQARSLLYVPGTRPERFDKAAASGADAIILDLEDAVPFDAKDIARAHVVAWLGASPEIEAWVRINGGALLAADARAVIEAGARKLYLPKASLEELAALDAIAGDADVSVTALIETATGVLDARAIAAADRVVRLAIGEADLGAELSITNEAAFAPMRAAVILASAAAKIEPPVGPVSTDFADLGALRMSTELLKGSGFGARAAIHPAQVAVINDVFTPTDEEVLRARRIVELAAASGGHATVDDEGRMLDEAIVRAARRILGN